jgi:hypothetical protein
MTPTKTVMPDKNGLVGSSGTCNHRQTNTTSFFNTTKTSEKSEKPKTLEQSEKLPPFSNRPIDLRRKSNKNRLNQPSITNFLYINPSATSLNTCKQYDSPPTFTVLPKADTPIKPLPPCRHSNYTHITPINLSTIYPLPSQIPNDTGPSTTAQTRPPPTRQSIITSYFTPIGGQRHLPLSKSAQHMPPCTSNMSTRYPTSSQQNHIPPSTNTSHLLPQLTTLSAVDSQEGQRLSPQHSELPSVVLDHLPTKMLPSTPTHPASINTQATNDLPLSSPPQQQPAHPTLEFAMQPLFPQNGVAKQAYPSPQHLALTQPQNNVMITLSITSSPTQNNGNSPLYGASDRNTSQSQESTSEGQLPEPVPKEQLRKRGGHKRILLQYNTPPVSQPRLSYFQSAQLNTDLHDSWGHSMEIIDPSSTFRIFLQNPNGLNISHTNYSLQHDLDTCRKYGAAVIALPETDTNWESREHLGIFNRVLKKTWDPVSTSTSRAVEPFLSSYQPGGTATIVCNNSTSRVIGRGEDPYGLGRWSYVILRG